MVSSGTPAAAARPAPMPWRASLHRFTAWLTPSPAESVRIRPRLNAQTGTEAGDLRSALECSTVEVRRAWRVAMVRRALLCIVPAVLLLTMLADGRPWSHWLEAASALVVATALVVSLDRRAPGTDAAARFLDRELGLQEQLATALEVETRAVGPVSPLGIKLREQAIRTAKDASSRWSARAASAIREWAVLALLVCLAVAVGFMPPAGSRTTHPNAATAPALPGAQIVNTLPAMPGSSRSAHAITVQVAVVSTPESSTRHAVKGIPTVQPRAAAPRRATAGRASVTRAGSKQGTASRHTASGGTKNTGKAATGSPQHTVPLLNPSESFLPTSPTTKGQKGTFSSGTQSKSGSARGSSQAGAQRGKTGTATRGAGGTAGATKGATQSGQSAGSPANSAGGKQGTSATNGKASQCLYTCSRITRSQLTAPGLITGKGQFTGKGTPGGKTAGHASGAAPKLGSASGAKPGTSTHQLNITSAYGAAHPGGRSAKQVQGHNGPGGAQQSGAAAGANGRQTIDYVAPDANIVLPGDNALVARYFTPHTTS